MKEFRDQCQSKIASKSFSPSDFEKSMARQSQKTRTYKNHFIIILGIHDFLNESGPKLQRVFDSSCGFWNVQSVLMQHIEEMVENMTKLRLNTRLLCQMGPEEVLESRMLT